MGLECVGVPPAPLVTLAGVLWGVVPGTALVLSCGLVSALFCFLVGRRFQAGLLKRLEDKPAVNEKFTLLNEIINKGGFRAVLLLRVIPTPLPLINYLYGVTSAPLPMFMLATAIGYFPGTLAFVYSGAAGKALLVGSATKPWYAYASALALSAVAGKYVAEFLNETLEKISTSP